MAGSDLRGDEVLLAELLAGSTVKDAATKAGLSERTARRRVARPEFRAQLDEWRREVAASVAAGLADLADAALEATADLLASDETPAAVKRGLIRDIFDAFRALGVEADNAARLSALEAKLGVDSRTGWKAAT